MLSKQFLIMSWIFWDYIQQVYQIPPFFYSVYCGFVDFSLALSKCENTVQIFNSKTFGTFSSILHYLNYLEPTKRATSANFDNRHSKNVWIVHLVISLWDSIALSKFDNTISKLLIPKHFENFVNVYNCLNFKLLGHSDACFQFRELVWIKKMKIPKY